MNNVCLAGRSTKDAEMRYTQGEKPMAIARFTLAIPRRRKPGSDEQEADFINCTAFGKTAEFCEKYVRKGTKFNVVGHIQTGSYTNKDGNKVYTTDVIVDQIEFAESKGSAQPVPETPIPESAPDDFINIPDNIADELPFD